MNTKEKQDNVKFHHLRFKIFPHTQLEVDEGDFFKQVGLTSTETFCNEEMTFRKGAILSVGGVTAAYALEAEKAPRVKVGVTKCSINDLFRKETGRVISSGRLQKAESTEKDQNGVLYINLPEDDNRSLGIITREQIIDAFNDGEVKAVERDLARIRSYVASKTKYPFTAELS